MRSQKKEEGKRGKGEKGNLCASVSRCFISAQSLRPLRLCGEKFSQPHRIALIALLTLSLAACTSSAITPVEIHGEDMCAHCRMAISETQFAAEFITKDGDAFKFDDLGCQADYVATKKNRDQIAAFFVMDYETKQWLKAEDAVFVHSPKFLTPMSGNIVAYKDKVKAEAAAAANGGKLLRFEEVLRYNRKAGA